VITPYLILGGGRYLGMSGEIAESNLSSADIDQYRTIFPDFDADTEGAPGPPERLTDGNRGYWTDVASRAGLRLDSLLAP